jgi:uncharacterized protein involved in exopolysaccharide biosynthesis
LKLLAEDQQLRESMEALLVRPGDNATFQEMAQKRKKVRQAISKEHEAARPRILKELMDKIRGQSRIAGLEEIEKLLLSEVWRLDTIVQSQVDKGIELDDFRDEIGHVENLVKRLVNEEQALNVELEAPTEFKVLEEAHILPPKTKSRMALMNAGVAVGGFALALLAVGWWDFSRRGRPAQLRAPRRRWLLAATCGLLASTLAAVGVWFGMPMKYTASTILHVSVKEPKVLGGDVAHGDFSIYQNSQAAMITSRLVLNAVL